mgnify:CR=1 FL=1
MRGRTLNRIGPLASVVVLIMLLGSYHCARASLVYGGSVDTSGGFGTELNILTFHSAGVEVGCVRWNGTNDAYGAPCPGLDPIPNPPGTANQVNNKSETFTIQELINQGIASAGELGIVLDASESGGGPITVQQIILYIYNSSGALLDSYVYTGPTVFAGNTGSGGQGQIFQLDYDQATAANVYWSDPLNRIGLAAWLTDADSGGTDSFYIDDFTALPVPEPVSSLTIGSGLIAFAFLLRWRARKSG